MPMTKVSCIATMAAGSLDLGAYFQANPQSVKGMKSYADTMIMLHGHDGENVIDQLVEFGDRYPLAKISSEMKNKHLLLIGGELDQVVPLPIHENYVAAFSANPSLDVTSVTFPADHSFSTHRIALERTIGQWLDGNCR